MKQPEKCGRKREMNEVDARRERHKADGWIGVDLDGTLAYYDRWVAIDVIGDPIPRMVERVKRWLSEGYDVRIMTARIHYENGNHLKHCLVTGKAWSKRAIEKIIQEWTWKHLGARLPVTCVKDFKMIELWDDRAIQVEPNTGRALVDELTAELSALKGAP
jgi:hypothetical protein